MLLRLFGTTSTVLAMWSARAKGEELGEATSEHMSKVCGLASMQQYAAVAPRGHDEDTLSTNSKTPSAQPCVTKTSHMRPSGCLRRAQLAWPAAALEGFSSCSVTV